MNTPSYSSRQISLTALLLAILASAFIIIALWDRAYDDPFITYRYARNLAQGIGFVYNPGERVLSTTTPLFTLLLASLFPLWPDLPHLANLIGALSLGLGAYFLWDLGNSWGTNMGSWGFLLLYPTFPLVAGTLGSETPLFLALCLGAFAIYARENQLLAAIFSALAVLTRPDGALVPIVLSVDYIFKNRHLPPWKNFLVFGLLTLPWFAFAWIYFGSPLPVTLIVKQHQGSLPVSQHFLPGLITVAGWYANNRVYQLETAMASIGLALAIWHRRGWLLLLAWTAIYALVYQFLGVGRYFWYYAPLVPAFVILASLGLTAPEYLYHSPSHPNKPFAWFASVLKMASILFLVSLSCMQARSIWQMRDRPDLRLPIYQSIGKWLNANTPPEARVGMLEVGIIGYYARRPVIDFAGLIQPDVAAQMNPATTYEDAALWAVRQYQPEYIVLHANAFPQLEQSYIAQNCLLIKVFRGQPYGYTANMHIYACQSRPAINSSRLPEISKPLRERTQAETGS